MPSFITPNSDSQPEFTELREEWSAAARAAAAAARGRRKKGGSKEEVNRSAARAFSKAGGTSASRSGGKAALAAHDRAAARHGLTVTKREEQYKKMGGAFTSFASNKHGIAGISFSHSQSQRGGRDEARKNRYVVTDHSGRAMARAGTAHAALSKAKRKSGM